MKQNIITQALPLALAFTLVGCGPPYTPTILKLDPTGPNVWKQTVGDLTLYVEEYAAEGKWKEAFVLDLATEEVLPLLIKVTNSGKASYEVKSKDIVVRGQSILNRFDAEKAATKLQTSVLAATAVGAGTGILLLPLAPLFGGVLAASTYTRNKQIIENLVDKKFEQGVILPHSSREGFLYFELYKDRKDLSNLIIELTARNTVTGRTLAISAPVPPVSLERKCPGEDDDPPECDSAEETPVASAPQPQPQVTPPPPKVAPAPSPEQLSMEKRLQKLMELRQKNLITGEEYQKAKKDVLKKLTE